MLESCCYRRQVSVHLNQRCGSSAATSFGVNLHLFCTMYNNTLCMRADKSLTSLLICAGQNEKYKTRMCWSILFFSGLVLTLPCIDELRIVDIRTFFYDIQPQKVCTN